MSALENYIYCKTLTIFLIPVHQFLPNGTKFVFMSFGFL